MKQWVTAAHRPLFFKCRDPVLASVVFYFEVCLHYKAKSMSHSLLQHSNSTTERPNGHTEETLISNLSIFFYSALIYRPESLQLATLAKNKHTQTHTHRESAPGPARWLGPKYYMPGLCRNLQLNCTANRSVNCH